MHGFPMHKCKHRGCQAQQPTSCGCGRGRGRGRGSDSGSCGG